MTPSYLHQPIIEAVSKESAINQVAMLKNCFKSMLEPNRSVFVLVFYYLNQFEYMVLINHQYQYFDNMYMEYRDGILDKNYLLILILY